MSCMKRVLWHILSMWMMFGDTCEENEDFGRSAPLFYYYHEKVLTLQVGCSK